MSDSIRRPAAAGTFYPNNSVELTRTIAGLFSDTRKLALPSRPLAVIAPHAGYPYSGKVAARAYKLLEGEEYDNVVVVSPSHTVFFRGSAIYDGAGYQTPLGVVEIDQPLSQKIAELNPSSVYLSSMGHSTGDTRGEHALEVQLPFLQIVLGKFKLVAVVMGDQESDSVNALGEALGAALAGTNTLLVASTDLSHFHSEKEARKLDFEVQQAIEKFDPSTLLDTLSDGKGEACGGGPVAAVMLAAKRMGAKEVMSLDYATSGEVTGHFEDVVGYLSAAIVGGKDVKVKKASPVAGKLAAKKKLALTSIAIEKLHEIAKAAVKAKLAGEDYEAPSHPELTTTQGAFVTINKEGNLRGCIGQIRGRQPLYKTIAEMAQAAAFDDPRFPALTEDEFDELEFEISVLSPLTRVKDFSEIEVGKHGLLVKLDMHSGLLLPQVASEYGWSVREFLEQTCLKAGLPKESYKDKFAEVYVFEAQVF